LEDSAAIDGSAFNVFSLNAFMKNLLTLTTITEVISSDNGEEIIKSL
jgi:hypothetical protein